MKHDADSEAEEVKTGTVKKTISLKPEVYKRAEEQRKRTNRNFSNHMAALILGDPIATEAAAENREAVAA